MDKGAEKIFSPCKKYRLAEYVMKNFKRRMLHAVLLCCMIIITVSCPDICVQAGEGISAIEQAKTNVFRIEVSILCDGKSEPEFIRSGTCFLVGNEERDQEQYLITVKSNLDVSEKRIKKYRKKNGLEKDDHVEIVYEIVISEDIRRMASVYDRAQDSNYAILTLNETIKGCPGLTLGVPAQAKKDAAVFLLAYDSNAYQVNLESTHLGMSDEKKIFFQAQTSEDYGAPIVDESGCLLGMEIPLETEGIDLAEGLSADVLRHAFDTLGILYEHSDSKIFVLEEKIEDAVQMADSGAYTKKTVEVLQAAIGDAQDVYDDVRATDSDYEDQVKRLETAILQLKPMQEIYRLIMLALAGVILLIALIILVVWLRNRKRDKRLQYYADEQEDKTVQRGKAVPLDMEMTVELSEKRPTAYLIHRNSGTRLLIAKDNFVLGSKKGSTDYCITGNPAVSRRHAAIVNEGGILFLKDLESMNHSYVNDRQLEPGEKLVIRNQDIIRLANEEFVFEMR